MKDPIAAYSAPGKALLAGGYLVLFPEFSAFSVSLSSRIHAVAYDTPSDELILKSPQFDSEWKFPSRTGTHKNPFLEACYDTLRQYFGRDITGSIVIYSDGGFHSQKNAQQNYFSGAKQRFSYHGKPITEVSKTGLGSSAALVVAVVAAMARLAEPTNSDLNLVKIHNLAQVAHCLAQQKVGSGFDVATAVYGSIMYSRFQPDVIPKQLNHESLKQIVDQTWEMTAEAVKLPNNITVVMGDVSQGSETPGMVKKVLQWRSENPEEASKLFANLNDANMALVNALNSKHENRSQISVAIGSIRKYLKQLTLLSGVPIEPDRQTRILDAASKINGVLGGVVPGAGGDDAVCLLVDTSVNTLGEIFNLLNSIEGVSWMNLGLESKGLLSEPAKSYI